MHGLFFDIKSYFKSEYHGRYFAILLRELARHEPDSFAAIVSEIAKQAPHAKWTALAKRVRSDGAMNADREFSFKTQNEKSRLADVALSDERGQPLALFEIKEFDNKNPANKPQLRDYLAYTRGRDIPFVHLSRFHPEPDESDAMEKQRLKGQAVGSLLYRDIHAALRTAKRPIAAMVQEYLEDNHVGIYKPLDMKRNKDGAAIAYLVTRTCMFPHSHGLGKLHGDETIDLASSVMEKVFTNLEYLAEQVRAANPEMIPIRFAREFRPSPQFDLFALQKAFKGSDVAEGDGDTLPGGTSKYVQSGEILFEAQANLFTGLPRDALGLSVHLGFSFEVELRRKNPMVAVYFFTWFSEAQKNRQLWGWDKARSVSGIRAKLTEKDSDELLWKHMGESLKLARREASHPKARAALRRFCIAT